MFETLKSSLEGSAALLTFFSIFSAGLVFTIFSLIFGGDHDGGDVHGEMHDGGGESGDDDGQGPGMLSLRGISLMATGFGAMAYIVMYLTKKVLTASIAGLGFGWVFAFICIALLRIFIRQQGSSMISQGSCLNSIGEVTTVIPEHGLGEVRLVVEGVSMTKTASSARGVRVPTGATVKVVRVLGSTVSVEELSS